MQARGDWCTGGHGGLRFFKSYAAAPESSGEIRRGLGAYARKAGVPGATVERVLLAVSEAANNVVLHAYRDCDRPEMIHVEATLAGDELSVSVIDSGGGLRPRPDSPGLGLGLAILGRLARDVELLQDGDSGLRVVMRFPVPAADK